MKKDDVPWYVDTSAVVSLLFGHPLVKKNIRSHLQGKASWTSFYVQMEFKRLVVKTLIDFYYVAKEEDTASAALQVWNQTFEARGLKIVVGAIAQLIAEGGLENDKDKFLVKLTMLIEAALVSFDTILPNFVKNQTKCPLAKANLNRGHEGFYEEIECTANCSVDSLWRGSRKKLQDFVSASEVEPHSKNDGFTRNIETVKAAVTNPDYPKTKSRCKKVGDFLIALEMPNTMRMLTSDRAFESICAVLGKQFTVLPSLAQLKSTL